MNPYRPTVGNLQPQGPVQHSQPPVDYYRQAQDRYPPGGVGGRAPGVRCSPEVDRAPWPRADRVAPTGGGAWPDPAPQGPQGGVPHDPAPRPGVSRPYIPISPYAPVVGDPYAPAAEAPYAPAVGGPYAPAVETPYAPVVGGAAPPNGGHELRPVTIPNLRYVEPRKRTRQGSRLGSNQRARQRQYRALESEALDDSPPPAYEEFQSEAEDSYPLAGSPPAPYVDIQPEDEEDAEDEELNDCLPPTYEDFQTTQPRQVPRSRKKNRPTAATRLARKRAAQPAAEVLPRTYQVAVGPKGGPEGGSEGGTEGGTEGLRRNRGRSRGGKRWSGTNTKISYGSWES